MARAADEQQLGCPRFRHISETTDEERQRIELEAVDPVVSEPSFPGACVDGSQVEMAVFVQTGDPLLLICGASGQCNQGNTAVAYI